MNLYPKSYSWRIIRMIMTADQREALDELSKSGERIDALFSQYVPLLRDIDPKVAYWSRQSTCKQL